MPPITFYDIASKPPETCFAPNPWKTRYVLNYTQAPYTTIWTDLPSITSVRKSLNLPTNRTHADGSPFYTLPIIHDSTTDTTIGDSFDIALYLDRHYSSSSTQLFKGSSNSSVSLYSGWNSYVDSLFSPFWGLFVHGIPFNPSTAGESKAEFVKRAGVEKWDDLRAQGQDREGMLARFEAALGGLARAYGFADSGTGIGRGRFLEGERPTYADFVVGAWLQFIQATVPEWEVVREWHGGLWGRVIDSLEEWAR